jgi:hypothetical protein
MVFIIKYINIKMPFNLIYYYNGLFPYFEFEEDVTNEDVNNLLDILSQLMKKDPFVFLLDGRKIKNFPIIKPSYNILNWMISERKQIPKKILASAIIINNDSLVKTMEWIFEKKPPMNPNIITKDHFKGMEFIKKYIPNN